MQRPATVELRLTLFREAVRIVETEYASDLSLDEVAARVSTSRRQLQRAYAEVGNTSFRTLLAQVRMERAAQMLAGGASVREASRRVGYRQPAQFAKAFRRHLGRMPSELRAAESGRSRRALSRAA